MQVFLIQAVTDELLSILLPVVRTDTWIKKHTSFYTVIRVENWMYIRYALRKEGQKHAVLLQCLLWIIRCVFLIFHTDVC